MFTELEQGRREKPQNQVIEVMVDGKIQIFEIQPVEASLQPDNMINYAESENINQFSSSEPEYINLDTSTPHPDLPGPQSVDIKKIFLVK